jgi:hypothetical protein
MFITASAIRAPNLGPMLINRTSYRSCHPTRQRRLETVKADQGRGKACSVTIPVAFLHALAPQLWCRVFLPLLGRNSVTV